MGKKRVIPVDSPTTPMAFTFARHDAQQNRRFPQAIAHRGYKAAFPENSLPAFEGALSAGAHALETDLHLSADDELVLSHDASLKRCFGRDERVADLPWADLAPLRALVPPHPHIARLPDLLAVLARPANAHAWLLLDIKSDDDPARLVAALARDLGGAPQHGAPPWTRRVVLGPWSRVYLPLFEEYLPDFPVACIQFSLSYAERYFLPVPGAGFNMLVMALMGPGGVRFIERVHAKGRPVYAWTVNDRGRMAWCVKKGLDGVVTDDPAAFLKLCENWGGEGEQAVDECWTWRTIVRVVLVYVLSALLGGLLFRRVERRQVKQIEHGSHALKRAGKKHAVG